jgi:hypothetical protein
MFVSGFGFQLAVAVAARRTEAETSRKSAVNRNVTAGRL